MWEWPFEIDRHTRRGRLVSWLDAHARPILVSLIVVDLGLTWGTYFQAVPGLPAAIAQTAIGLATGLELLIVFDYVVSLSATGHLGVDGKAALSIDDGSQYDGGGGEDGK